MLYSREPRSSVCPSRRTCVAGCAARYFACAATTCMPSPLSSLLSKSKYMTRVASSPPCGPAASSSALPPAAFAPAAPAAPAPALSPPGGAAAAGFACLLAQPATPSDRANTSTAIILLCILVLSHMLSWSEWPPGRLADLPFRSLQAHAGKPIGRYRSERATVALALRIDKCSSIGREARGFVEMPVRQHAHGASGQVLHRDAVVAVVECHHRQLRAVGRHLRARVVVAGESDALGMRAALNWHL